MSLRRVLLALASTALSVVLIALLIRVGKIDVRLTLHQLEGVSRTVFIKLVLLNALLIYISTEKWRSIDAALRHASDSVPPRTTSFAVTSAGMALGLVIPVQLGMTVARTLGTSVYGRPLKRGTAGTLFEQSFDLLIVAFLTVASGATWFYGGGGVMWTVSAALMTALALLAVEPSIRLVQWLSSYASRNATRKNPTGVPNLRKWLVERALRSISELQDSGALNVGLARRLVMLSAVRFLTLVLMAGQTTEAICAHIPLWHMAAAMPFVAVANATAVTPGGLGVNELTSAMALHLFGTPLAIASQWALANRFLVVASCFVVAACAAMTIGVQKSVAPGTRDANKR
jgi:uncharacterized membrane protein YbhN (UPF0104 family)